MSHANAESIIAAYIFLSCLLLSAVSLLCLIIHLLYRTGKEESESALFFVIITIIGITSFLLSILCVIAIAIELILVDGYHFAQSSSSLYLSFKYLSVIFDSFGHLSMLTIFIFRLHHCFKNSILAYSKLLRYCMFGILGVLIISNLLIALEIVFHGENSFTVIVSEIVWELGIEGTSVWILCLFTKGLYKLLKSNLGAVSKPSGPKRHRSDLSLVHSVVLNRDLTRTRSLSEMKAKPDSTTKKCTSGAQETRNEPQPSIWRNSEAALVAQIGDIITVMNKMTFLVMIAVFVSILTMAGNVLVELYASRTLEEDNTTMHLHILWSYVLPAIDVVITAFMLYLQFNFTSSVYDRLCCGLDGMVLRLCIYFLRKTEQQKNRKKALELRSHSLLDNVHPAADQCAAPQPDPEAPSLHKTDEAETCTSDRAIDCTLSSDTQPQTKVIQNTEGLQVSIH